jgi:RTX calcium-binding nonapeptide repeat (4 copies)
MSPTQWVIGGILGLAVIAGVVVAVITNFGRPPNPASSPQPGQNAPANPPGKGDKLKQAIDEAKAPPAGDEEGPKVAGQAQGSGGDAGGCPPGYVHVDTVAFPPGHVPIATVAFTGALATSLWAQADQYQYEQTEPPAAPKKSSGCKANTIKGTKKAETIEGTKKADLILGGAGDDKIKAGLGNDKVVGGPGNDTIITVLSPSNIRDTIRAGPGNDDVFITLSRSIISNKKLVVWQRVDCGRGFDHYRAIFRFNEEMWREAG